MDAIVYSMLLVRYLCVYGRVDWGLGCWVMGCVVSSWFGFGYFGVFVFCCVVVYVRFRFKCVDGAKIDSEQLWC